MVHQEPWMQTTRQLGEVVLGAGGLCVTLDAEPPHLVVGAVAQAAQGPAQLFQVTARTAVERLSQPASLGDFRSDESSPRRADLLDPLREASLEVGIGLQQFGGGEDAVRSPG